MTILNLLIDLANASSSQVNALLNSQPRDVREVYLSNDSSQIKIKLTNNQNNYFACERAVADINLLRK